MRTILYARPPIHLMSTQLHGEVADEVQHIAADFFGVDADSFNEVVADRSHDYGNAAVTFDGNQIVDRIEFDINWVEVSGGAGL